MWKDFFYFTKKERQGIIVLLSIIFGVFIGKFFFSKSNEDIKKEEITFTQNQKDKPNEIDTQTGINSDKKNNDSNLKIIPKPFDPNSEDSLSLVSLGIKPYVVRNIIKYRDKGGKFKNSDDFSKVYGLNKSDFERLKPYIQMTETKIIKEVKEMKEFNKIGEKQEKITLGTFININEADTSMLKKISGIGSGFANRIIKYREILGGFYSVEQIREVYGVDDILFTKIAPFITISENDSIKKIPVNQYSLDKLKSHPYINFYQAKTIIDIRKKRGKVQSLSELSLLEEFPQKELDRLSYYLEF